MIIKNGDFSLFNELIKIWNNSTEKYKTKETDKNDKFRRIYIERLKYIMRYEFMYKCKSNIITLRINNKASNIFLAEYMEIWNKKIEINGQKFTSKFKHILEMDLILKHENIDLIIMYMKKIIELTENGINYTIEQMNARLNFPIDYFVSIELLNLENIKIRRKYEQLEIEKPVPYKCSI